MGDRQADVQQNMVLTHSILADVRTSTTLEARYYYLDRDLISSSKVERTRFDKKMEGKVALTLGHPPTTQPH